ncbi:helix-turn-helix domain-containing protein [Mycolicibacterium thermoresistibile]
MSSVDLLLHPVRFRIVQTFLDGRGRTTGQLREQLDDVAPATLYRHIAKLADAGVLEVADEQRVRGATERTYRLRRERADLGPDAAATMTLDDHRRVFTTLVTSLLADFDRYLQRDGADPAADGVAFRQAALWLTEDELLTMLGELGEVIAARAGNEPQAGRTRRMLTTVLVPALR